MDPMQAYIIVSVAAALAAVVLVFFVRNNVRDIEFTPLGSIGLAFVVAGLFWSIDQVIGYILLGIGVGLSAVDAVTRRKKA